MSAAPASKVIKWVHTSRPKSKLRRVSFGTTAAIVTSVGLTTGLDAAKALRRGARRRRTQRASWDLGLDRCWLSVLAPGSLL